MHERPTLHPVRWWRTDATRYQSRPPFQDAPCLTPEQTQYLDALGAFHVAYQAANLSRWEGDGSVPFPKVESITPVEFERLEPQRFTPEQESEFERQIAAAFARGDFKLPEPVFVLCTIGEP